MNQKAKKTSDSSKILVIHKYEAEDIPSEHNFFLANLELKSDSHLPKKNYFIGSPLKMMKNASYFILKAFFRSQDV